MASDKLSFSIYYIMWNLDDRAIYLWIKYNSVETSVSNLLWHSTLQDNQWLAASLSVWSFCHAPTGASEICSQWSTMPSQSEGHTLETVCHRFLCSVQ